MLIEKIDNDLKQAMKSRDLAKVETLRFLKAAVGNFLIEKRKDKPEDSELIGLIQKQIKLREDSIDCYKKANRSDLLQKETHEKTILESYLPPGLSDQEIETLVKKVIEDTRAASKADLGKVMKEALARSQGRADGKRINQAAGKLLGAG